VTLKISMYLYMYIKYKCIHTYCRIRHFWADPPTHHTNTFGTTCAPPRLVYVSTTLDRFCHILVGVKPSETVSIISSSCSKKHRFFLLSSPIVYYLIIRYNRLWNTYSSNSDKGLKEKNVTEDNITKVL